ncbi:hypothetical protein DFA_08509 [Cavenderia fasciculata]|uniref:Uncharacterized protein n=1 Tax=Cavenderia fasciculata TaxID=261658 RepID=F4Q2P6_CACFS|nr:uncharacterized protein DFA_08509 [Cavenderia fasciculata]EGG17513.1 hypothetical protein DFA_08509 [Cavenderia fasciculata]|eukprot:XP_004355997.1 hypothetical protein DFA_08509 [Cavenderia fasciculata]
MSTKKFNKFVSPVKSITTASTSTSSPTKTGKNGASSFKSFVSPVIGSSTTAPPPPTKKKSSVSTSIASPKKMPSKQTTVKSTTTKPKTIDPFKHLPYLSQSEEREDCKTDQANDIIEFLYNLNQPVTLNELQSHFKANVILKEDIDELVNKRILNETKLYLNENKTKITLYSSMKWTKVNQQYIKFRLYDKQKQLEKEEKEQLEKQRKDINNNINVNKNEKKVLASNHLDQKKTPVKKLGTSFTTASSSITTTSPIKNHLVSSFQSPLKKIKTLDDDSTIGLLEEQMDKKLVEASQERIRLLASIEAKRKQLQKLVDQGVDIQSLVPTKDQEKDELNEKKELEKVKQGCRDLINRLHVHIAEANKGMDDGLGALSSSYRDSRSVGFKSSRDWNDDSDSYSSRSSRSDDQDQDEINYNDEDGGMGGGQPKDPLAGISKTSKLYVIKGYGIDPESLGYDEDSDDFIVPPPPTVVSKVTPKKK